MMLSLKLRVQAMLSCQQVKVEANGIQIMIPFWNFKANANRVSS